MAACTIDRAEALNVIGRYLFDGAETPLSVLAAAHPTYDDNQSFAAMRGSGNGMSVFERFLGLTLNRGLISENEAIGYILSVNGGGQL